MLKRTGFKRPEISHAPPSSPKRLERPVVMADCSAMSQPIVKTEPRRNPHLLTMARGKPCLLIVDGVCKGETETTVAAHSNLLSHGKGKARKADDCFSVWSCARCHTWLDSRYDATFEQREAAFLIGFGSQVAEWKAINESASSSPKDRAAARWALDQLRQLGRTV